MENGNTALPNAEQGSAQNTGPSIIDGRYEIVKSLGGGLSGEVHLVKDDEGTKALKFLKKVQMGVSREEALTNFKNEFAILKELNHPNIARILDFGYEVRSQKYYFTTEYVSGRELHTACEGQSFEVMERLIVQVLRALNYLHTRGIYHFDIKPQNVLVAMQDGVPDQAKMIDFGLAGYSTPRKKVGTPAYMAPEVIQGGPLDGRTDLYSTGVLIYRLFTGQNPFASKSLRETLDKQVQFVPPPPSSINRDVPEYWDHIVARLMEKNPAQRYSQASLVIRDLNFLSQKNFEIETRDTKISYLPEKGALIGREKAWQEFTDIFSSQFEKETPGETRLLVICGERGTGKSRMLSEIKYFSQLRNVPVKTLRQFRTESAAEKFILSVDESDQVSPDTINALLHELIGSNVLVIWAVTAAPRNWENIHVVTLSNYTRDQLKLYLESVTGLEQVPTKLLDEVFRRTLGNPLYVTEFVKSLLESNLLFDEAGKWDAKTFEDVRIDFSKIVIPSSIEECVLQRLNQLSDEANEVIIWLAVNHQPLRLDHLQELCGCKDLPVIITELVTQNILEKTSRESHYFFTNILYADVLYRELPDSKRYEYHAILAGLFSKLADEQDWYLYHSGNVEDASEAIRALISRAKAHYSQTKYESAAAIIYKLLSRFPDPKEEQLEVYELLGDAEYEAIHYAKAFDAYVKALESAENKEPNFRLRLLSRLADVCNKQDRLDEAERWIEQAMTLAKSIHHVAYTMIITNMHAHVLMKRGKVGEARTIMESTQKDWCLLSKDQQALVFNNRIYDIYIMLKDYARAIKVCEQNVSIYEKLGLQVHLARNYYALGAAYSCMLIEKLLNIDQKDIFQKCISSLNKSEKIAREINDSKLLAVVYNSLANVFVHEKQFEQALEAYNRAIVIARSIGNITNAATISMNCGNIYKMMTQYNDAYSHLVYAINSLENITEKTAHDWLYLWQAYIELSECYCKMKQPVRGREMIGKAARIREENAFLSGYEFWEHLGMTRCYLAEERRDRAMESFEKTKLKATSSLELDEIKKLEIEMVNGEVVQKSASSRGYRIMKDVNENMAAANNGNDLKTIIQINRIINAEHDVEHLLKMVLTYALELTRAEAGFVLLLTDDGSFEVKASINAKADDEEKISMSIAKAAIESGEIINSADALSDDRFDNSESVVLNELKSVLCLPIRSKNKSIGVFYLDNRYRVNAFAESNVLLVNAFCDQVGIALENARLISDLTEAKEKLQVRLTETSAELAEAKAILKEESETYKTRYVYKNIIATSKSMQDIFKLLDKVTETNLTICIHGESGTGKELVAKALHYNNPQREKKRFVAINCGAIPANLMESEMFGHKAGSFTGATGDKKGLFEEANGGTLFLDEIGELDMQLQVKLLRVLQEGEVQRIGEARSIKIDVRVVCASHRNLQEMVKQGKFREDLFYRLCQMKIDLPPLRERREDIPLLAKHFVDKFRKSNNLNDTIEVPPVFMKALVEYEWTGNIRELENLISVACALREGKGLSLASLPPSYAIAQKASSMNEVSVNLANQSGPQIAIDAKNFFDPNKTWDDYEAVIMAKCYELHNKKKIPTAEALDLSHSTLYKKVADLALDDGSNPLYADAYIYEPGVTMKSLVVKIFEAALKYHEGHPYAAIRQLKVSQGYFYKVMKNFNPASATTENPAP